MTDDDPALDLAEAAQQLGVAIITVRRYIGQDRHRQPGAPTLPHERTAGGRIRIRQSEINKWKDQYPT